MLFGQAYMFILQCYGIGVPIHWSKNNLTSAPTKRVWWQSPVNSTRVKDRRCGFDLSVISDVISSVTSHCVITSSTSSSSSSKMTHYWRPTFRGICFVAVSEGRNNPLPHRSSARFWWFSASVRPCTSVRVHTWHLKESFCFFLEIVDVSGIFCDIGSVDLLHQYGITTQLQL